MDLILLQPGNADDIIGDYSSSPIDYQVRDLVERFGKCIKLVSFHYDVKQPITVDVGNRTPPPGRPAITEITCVKLFDQTSVKLYEYCLRAFPLDSGADKPTRIYIVRDSGESTANIITLSLRDAIISEIQLQPHPGDMLAEQFKINFTEILWTYNVARNTDTTPAGNAQTGWSVTHNRPIDSFT